MTQTATLSELIAAHARGTPRAPAILAPGRAPLCYEDLLRQMSETAASLARGGIGRGCRVALALPNGPETAVVLASVMSCATCVPINPQADTEALRALLQRTRVSALIVGDGTPPQASRVAHDCGVRIARLTPIGNGAAGAHTVGFDDEAQPVTPEAPSGEDIALVLHTSGTTGQPKIVPLTQRSQVEEARHRVAVWRFGPADCTICVAPLFSASALRRSLFPMLAVGGRVVCPPSFDGERLYDWLSQFEPTFYAAGPAVHRSLLEAVERRGRRPAHVLRYVISGSTALSVPLQTRFEQALGIPVIQTYAMTEAGGIAQDLLPPAQRRLGSVGLASRGEVAIVDGDVFLPRGETGEIVVRGPQVFAGYEGDPQATRAAFLDDWFRTGDVGYLDGDGYLFITGRAKEIINRGGFKVSPSEVDAALARHPAVKDVATCGVPHASLGEDVVAVVVTQDAAKVSTQELRDFAFASLADYKVPTRVVVVDSIPEQRSARCGAATWRRCWPALRAPSLRHRPTSASAALRAPSERFWVWKASAARTTSSRSGATRCAAHRSPRV